MNKSHRSMVWPSTVTFFCLAFCLFLSTPSLAFTVSAMDGDSDNFGATLGFAIDFDGSGMGSDWTPEASYNVDQLSIFETSNESTDVYLGVYTDYLAIDGSVDKVSGFLGVADQMHRFDNGFAKTRRAWTFDDMRLTVTPENNPGAGDDVLYFIYQSSPDPITDLNMAKTHNTARLEGSQGSFEDDLSAIIRTPILNRAQLIKSRSPEYSLELSMVVPEPEYGGMFFLLIACCLTTYRRVTARAKSKRN